MIWTILSWVSLTLFVILAGYSIYKIVEQSKLYQNISFAPKFVQNPEAAKKNIGDYGNRIFKNQNAQTNNLLDYYMISMSSSHKYLKCHFQRPITEENMIAIRLFDVYRVCKKTLYVTYPKSMDNSSFIELPRDTVYVNVDLLENSDEISRICDTKSRLLHEYMKWSYLLFGSMLFLYIPLGYNLLSSLVGSQLPSHLNIDTYLLGISIMIVVILVNIWVMVLWTKSKDRLRSKVYEYIKADQ